MYYIITDYIFVLIKSMCTLMHDLDIYIYIVYRKLYKKIKLHKNNKYDIKTSRCNDLLRPRYK